MVHGIRDWETGFQSWLCLDGGVRPTPRSLCVFIFKTRGMTEVVNQVPWNFQIFLAKRMEVKGKWILDCLTHNNWSGGTSVPHVRILDKTSAWRRGNATNIHWKTTGLGDSLWTFYDPMPWKLSCLNCWPFKYDQKKKKKSESLIFPIKNYKTEDNEPQKIYVNY